MIINAFLVKIVGGWYEVKEELTINAVTGEYALYIPGCSSHSVIRSAGLWFYYWGLKGG